MRKIKTKTHAPFIVSIALIFGYSLTKAFLPPVVVGLENDAATLITATQESDDFVRKINHEEPNYPTKSQPLLPH